MPEVDYAKPLTPEQIREGGHRRRVGGRWKKMGRFQLDFLIENGLEPSSRLLDVACGPLRAGIHLVDYLGADNYYGIDINETLIDAGYEVELPAELRRKLPRDHLRSTGRFECDFGVEFDLAMAQSLFTHIPLNDIRLCLYQVAKVMKPGGRFFATFLEASDDVPLDAVLPPQSNRKKPRPAYSHRNPFWYWRADLEWAARVAPWRFRYIGDWGHPGNQKMMELTRTP